MELATFFDKIDEDKELVGSGIDVEQGILNIEYAPTHMVTALPIGAITKEEVDWPLLRSVLIGEREPKALYHLTRVVGYYSRIENFNKSKLGELKDRIKGTYSFDGNKRDVETAAAVVNDVANDA